MSLDLWRLKDFLSIHEACCLAVGVNPDRYAENDGSLFNIDGYRPIHETLESGLYEYVTEPSRRDFHFNDENILKTEDYGVNEFKLSVLLVKQLLKAKLIPSPFYDQIKDPQLDMETKVNEPASLKPRYTTKCLNILYKTIDRYYSSTFSLEDEDTHTEQAKIVEWLMDDNKLCKAEAERIDRVLRPTKENKV